MQKKKKEIRINNINKEEEKKNIHIDIRYNQFKVKKASQLFINCIFFFFAYMSSGDVLFGRIFLCKIDF